MAQWLVLTSLNRLISDTIFIAWPQWMTATPALNTSSDSRLSLRQQRTFPKQTAAPDTAMTASVQWKRPWRLSSTYKKMKACYEETFSHKINFIERINDVTLSQTCMTCYKVCSDAYMGASRELGRAFPIIWKELEHSVQSSHHNSTSQAVFQFCFKIASLTLANLH